MRHLKLKKLDARIALENFTALACIRPSIERGATMDKRRFDGLAKQLYVLRSRRTGLRILLAGLAAGAIGGTSADDAAAHCKRGGALCRTDEQCCSGNCKNKKHLKKKNGARTKEKIGKCECSGLHEPCHVADDCCFERDVCGSNDCDAHPVCCKPPGAVCSDDCDCCGFNVCDEDTGRCQPRFCSETQEPCLFTSDCCNDDEERCLSIDPDCNPQGTRQCCVLAGGECEEDCDCCVPSECVAGTCANPCSDSGEICTTPGSSSGCCNAGDLCFTTTCNGGTPQARCCRTLGPCEDDCDCCGTLACLSGQCGAS